MRHVALFVGACALLAGCGSQQSSRTSAAVAPERPDIVGVVEGASFQPVEGFERREYPAVDRRPFYNGDLVLADGTLIAITENTAGVDGCSTQERTPIGESRYVPDFAGCLAMALIDESGGALWVSLFDPLDKTPDRWGVSRTALKATDRDATFAEVFGERGAILEYSPNDADVRSAVTRSAGTCSGDGGEEWRDASTAFTVDRAGVIQTFVGYGDPDHPYDAPCDWAI